jgi:hypothetical protein
MNYGALLKPVATYGLVAVLGYFAGYNSSEIDNLRESTAIFDQVVQNHQAQVKEYTRIIGVHERTQAQLEQQERELNAQIETLIDDQTNAACTTSAGVTGVLLESRQIPGDDAATRGIDGADSCPSPFIEYRDLVSELNSMQVRYNQARTQCNSLIEWIETNYDLHQQASDQ